MTDLIDRSKSLPKMIESFLVGTEKRKAWKGKGPPKPSELGTVSIMSFHSTAKQAKIAMNRDLTKRNVSEEDQQSNEHATEDTASTDIILPPQYHKICRLVEAAGAVNDECKVIGFRLLNLCANSDVQTITLSQKIQMDKQAQCNWLMLQTNSQRIDQ